MVSYFGPLKCCSLRIFVFAIGILFLLVQTSFLISTFILMRDIEDYVGTFMDWMTKWIDFPPPKIVNGTVTEDHRSYVIEVSYSALRYAE